MPKAISIKMRQDNIIFECFMDKKIYYYEDDEPHTITFVQGVVPGDNNQGFMPVLLLVLICIKCWDAGVKAKKFEEPSPINLPTPELIKTLKEKGGIN